MILGLALSCRIFVSIASVHTPMLRRGLWGPVNLKSYDIFRVCVGLDGFQASAAPAMPMSVGGLHAAPSPGGMAGPGMPLNGSLNTAQYAASIPHLEDHGADSIGNLSGQTAQLLEQNLEVISQVHTVGSS